MTKPIDAVADALDVPARAREPRLTGVLKIDPDRVPGAPKGRVVLVTAMTPTPAGEGKTTTTIGLVDGLRARGVRAVGALREPSLGPLFGAKGGAVGGGKARVVPDDAINMHFTGDLHAVTSAHNLLAALVDNHMHFDGSPTLHPSHVTWGRVLDMNDRALRSIEVGLSTKKGPKRRDRVDITAASEVMAILCLSKDVEDLRARVDRIVVATDDSGRPVRAGDLHAGGAMAALLLEATRPNLVQTLEGSPVLVHGGPFGNVAQGTSSLIQTGLARRLADVVVTEAGFAFDLGGWKFFDLKCRAGGFLPGAIVLVATIRALRHHGGAKDYAVADVGAVERGVANVEAHLDAMRRLGLPAPIVALNRFHDDDADEIALVRARVAAHGGTLVEGTYFAEGGAGALALADAVTARLAESPTDCPSYQPLYRAEQPFREKVDAIARGVLGARDVALTDKAAAELAAIEAAGLAHMPVCLAKTHLSISDDAAVQGRPPPFTMTVTGVRAAAGAGFLVALCGAILTMPGLHAVPQAHHIDVERADDGWRVRGLR